MAKAYTELADCGIIDTGAGRAARVKRVKPIPEPLVRAAKTYADEARRLGASLDDAFNALCAVVKRAPMRSLHGVHRQRKVADGADGRG